MRDILQFAVECFVVIGATLLVVGNNTMDAFARCLLAVFFCLIWLAVKVRQGEADE